MQLVASPNAPAANTPDYPTPDTCIVSDVAMAPANDCAVHGTRRKVVDVNMLVGRVVGHVMSKQHAGPTADVQLTLAPGRHRLAVNAVALSFALSGILTAQMASIEGPEDNGVRVTTTADLRGVAVTISGDTIPPLGFVRAIASESSDASLGDPTLAHCRRLIEEQGGSIGLVEDGGRIALRIAFPPVLPVNVVPFTRDHDDGAVLSPTPRLRLVA